MVERNRLIRFVSIDDLVKMPVVEIEMEATATQEYTAQPRLFEQHKRKRKMTQSGEHKPSRHSFITGNVVRLSKRFPPRKAAPGPYHVVAQLPARDGQLQYRIKSGCEPFYRTATENELESDLGATAAAAAS